MQIFIFRSKKDATVHGFTRDKTGANLPPEYGPWEPLGGKAIPAGSALAGIGNADAVLIAMEAEGFYLARSETPVTHFPMPRQGSQARQVARDPNRPANSRAKWSK